MAKYRGWPIQLRIGKYIFRAVVVAQLITKSLPTSAICSSIESHRPFLSSVKEKRPGMAQFCF